MSGLSSSGYRTEPCKNYAPFLADIEKQSADRRAGVMAARNAEDDFGAAWAAFEYASSGFLRGLGVITLLSEFRGKATYSFERGLEFSMDAVPMLKFSAQRLWCSDAGKTFAIVDSNLAFQADGCAAQRLSIAVSADAARNGRNDAAMFVALAAPGAPDEPTGKRRTGLRKHKTAMAPFYLEGSGNIYVFLKKLAQLDHHIAQSRSDRERAALQRYSYAPIAGAEMPERVAVRSKPRGDAPGVGG